MKTFEFNTLAEDHVARCGLIVLQSDVTIEDEFRYYYQGLPVSLMVNRIPFVNEVTVETLKQMEGEITLSMSLFPFDAQFDCVGYGCTSGALHIGTEPIDNLINQSRPSKFVSNPMLAVEAGLNKLGARRVAYLAPYSQAISQGMVDELTNRGFEVPIAATFDEMQDRIVGRISPDSIKQACLALAESESFDAIFVSCTNMKCAHIITEIEQTTGVAMISSNQALAWHMADSLGLSDQIKDKGRLFQC